MQQKRSGPGALRSHGAHETSSGSRVKSTVAPGVVVLVLTVWQDAAARLVACGG
jgi:hypothetical protein